MGDENFYSAAERVGYYLEISKLSETLEQESRRYGRRFSEAEEAESK